MYQGGKKPLLYWISANFYYIFLVPPLPFIWKHVDSLIRNFKKDKDTVMLYKFTGDSIKLFLDAV
jgi:hypothetical protein